MIERIEKTKGNRPWSREFQTSLDQVNPSNANDAFI